MKTLYPEISPYNSFFLETNTVHSVYVEESGNLQGIPVIFLHGGPCSGTKPDHRRFFNPDCYRIILFDQRGCGLSTPFGELIDNNTQGLIDDMEAIRKSLNIEQWLVFGGSWGGALALLYAQQHTRYVKGLIVRGIFLARQQDVDWFTKEGVNRIYPEQWHRLTASIAASEQSEDLPEAIGRTLSGKDELSKRRVTKEWLAWSAQVALGNYYQPEEALEHISEKMLKQVQMELNYSRHHYFIKENQILENCHLLGNLPTIIIHGRYDLVCPVEAGLRLYQVLPHAEFIVLPNAGHVGQGEAMIDALVSATDRFTKML
jgi:proline iminopeptidase